MVHHGAVRFSGFHRLINAQRMPLSQRDMTGSCDRRELKVAYLPELGRTNRTALAGAGKGTPIDKLMTHFELPADRWKHLRTSNPIESTFATVKLRQRVTKGAGSRGAGLAMAYRLLLLAERSWRRLDGHELLPLVRAGVVFKDGVRVERDSGQVTVLANKKRHGKIAA